MRLLDSRPARAVMMTSERRGREAAHARRRGCEGPEIRTVILGGIDVNAIPNGSIVESCGAPGPCRRRRAGSRTERRQGSRWRSVALPGENGDNPARRGGRLRSAARKTALRGTSAAIGAEQRASLARFAPVRPTGKASLRAQAFPAGYRDSDNGRRRGPGRRTHFFNYSGRRAARQGEPGTRA